MSDSAAEISGSVSCWCLVQESDIDLAFLERRYRRRLSLTSRLALSAYHRCNPELTPCRTVFASRYGEYVRTYGILNHLASGEPASPAAFSVSVHNAPGGIVGIATHNPAPSTTLAGGSATVEAGFLEAAMQHAELGGTEDIVFIYVDEPLPSQYGRFVGASAHAYASGLRLNTGAKHQIHLSWSKTATTTYGPAGMSDVGHEIVSILEAGQGTCSSNDGRLIWNWRVDSK
ncbi:MAG: beta-ketoacyl synthase chain length factor [Gammaproteobacteria bacterium]|nr:beta-ketoacyl synthase chain length factor [Gammaproteobacteria bacterium]